jgi:hypothetical protein
MEECIVTNINTFDSLDLEDNLKVMKKIQKMVISKYMYRYENKDPFYIKALVSREDDSSVVFPEQTGNKIIPVCEGGSILFHEKIKFEVVKGKFFEYTFLVDPGQKFGEGSKSYKVLCKTEEFYEIEVMANSEEEAIETANKQELWYWNHHQPGKDDKVRPITSFVVWDNFKVTEINE